MKRVLFIAHSFHPSHCANAKRPFLIAKAFLEKGWDVDVLSSCSGLPKGAKENFLDLDNFRIFRMKDPLWKLNNWISCRKERSWKLLGALLRALSWPDPTNFWVLKATLFMRNVKFDQYDVIVCSIYPLSVLMLPLLLVQLKTSWILDYQDSVSAQFKRNPRKSPIHHFLCPLLEKMGEVRLDASPLRRIYF